jgi:hypothetical protein
MGLQQASFLLVEPVAAGRGREMHGVASTPLEEPRRDDRGVVAVVVRGYEFSIRSSWSGGWSDAAHVQA